MPYVVLLDIDTFAPAGATREILGDVDRAIDEINQHRPLPDHIGRKLADDLLYDRIYSSAVTEGNRLSRRETIALLNAGIIEAGSRKDVAEVRNLGIAALRLDEFVRDEVDLSEGVARELHRLVVDGMDSLEPGCYRQDDVAIAGSATLPPTATDIPDLMRQTTEQVRGQLETAHAVVLSAWAHWAITRIHPFRDGNGRVARLVQDYVLLRRHYLPVPLFAEDREGQYYDALETADQGDSSALVELISKNILRVADRYISAIREDSEKQDWIQAITRAATERVRETEHRRFVRWERRISALRLEFQDLAEELTSRVPGLTIRIRDYQGIDLEKYKSLHSRRRAERTWVFGVDLRYEETRLRFVFWAAAHHARPDDPADSLTEDPVVLVSMEEQQESFPDEGHSVYYRALDELDEAMVTVREIVVTGEGIARRRWNPVTHHDEWDFEVSPGEIARDFFSEVLRKLLIV
jgi:Fic family protein